MPSKTTSSKSFKRANKLRQSPTEPESKLWTYLRAHRIRDVHFRRQHPIGRYCVDFCAPRRKLVIELDGSQHLDREFQDQERTAFLRLKGYRVLRFWNNDVMNNLERVVIAIEQALIDGEQ